MNDIKIINKSLEDILFAVFTPIGAAINTQIIKGKMMSAIITPFKLPEIFKSENKKLYALIPKDVSSIKPIDTEVAFLISIFNIDTSIGTTIAPPPNPENADNIPPEVPIKKYPGNEPVFSF